MGWIGKIIGGTIGFAMGGSLGAVAGATLGHNFDKNEKKYLNRPSLSNGEETQLTFFVATFSMLAKLAKADGHITKNEINTIELFMDEDLALNSQSRQIGINIFKTAINSHETFQNFAIQFYNHFNNQPKILELMIDILFRVSIADGNLLDVEEKLILSAVQSFNLNNAKYLQIRSRYINDADKYYSILGCNRNDSDEIIKSHYRKLIMEHHPDKIASKGLPEEFIKFASDKFREIQNAYDEIKKERKN